MSFDQQTFAPVATNSTDAEAIYSYRSSDTIAEVLATGYFEDKIDQFKEDDWIFMALGDGIIITQVSADTSTVTQALPPVVLACVALTLTDIIVSGGQTTNRLIIGTTNQIQGINLATTSNNNTITFSSENFTSSISIVHQEILLTSLIGGNPTSQMVMGFINSAPPTASFAFLVATPTLGTLVDAISGSPVATSVTMTAGVYKMAMELDTDNLTSAFKDSEGNSGVLAVLGSYTSGTQTFMIAGANSANNLNDEMTVIWDASGATWTLPIDPSAVPHCQAV